MGDVSKFFDAKTFAVVGASRDSQKAGHIIFKNLLDAHKKVYAVNPNAEQILGQKSYKDISEIPAKIDAVIIATPTTTVPRILLDSAKLEIPTATIITAGFSETGNSDPEKRILKIAEEEKIQVLGPNTFGIIDTYTKMNTTFFTAEVREGEIAFISQSGAIGSAVLDKNPGISKFIAVGNSTQLDFSDFIEHLSKDEKTRIICIYMESLRENRGKRFIEVCKKCKKPIIILKAGKSKKGQLAAKSHTASLASESGIYEGVFKQAGIIEVSSITEMFNLAKLKLKYPQLDKNSKALIITNAGGLGVLTTDYCEENKILLAELSERSQKELKEILSEKSSIHNPLDILGDATAETYKKVLTQLENEKFFDYFIVLLTPQKMAEPEKTANSFLKCKKPVIACFSGGQQVQKAKQYMQQSKVIQFNEPKEMCEVLGKLN